MNTKIKAKQEKGITVLTLIIAVIAIIFIGLIVASIINKNTSNDTAIDANAGISSEQDVNKQEANKQEPNEEFVEKQEDGSKLNTSEQLQKTKTVDGLEITNIQLKESGGITTLLADVENKTSSVVTGKRISIDILDKTGNKITTVKGIIGEVNPGEKTQLNASVTDDVSNAYDFRINS